MARDRIEPRTVTCRTGHGLLFVDPLGFAFGGELVFQDRITVVFRAGLLLAVPDFPEAAAFFAGAVRGIKGEEPGIEFFECAPTSGAAHFRAHDGEPMFRIEKMGGAAADIERALNEVARLQDSLRVDRADYYVDGVLLEALQLPEMGDRHENSVHKEGVE